MDLVLMSASDAAAAIRNGTITSEELVQACLDHIAQLDDRVEAWAFLEPELALEQARKADLALQAGMEDCSIFGGHVPGVNYILNANRYTVQWAQCDAGLERQISLSGLFKGQLGLKKSPGLDPIF